MKPRLLSIISAAAALAVLGAAPAAHAAMPATGPGNTGFWILRLDGESLGDAIVRQAATSPAYAAQAKVQARVWDQQLSAGWNPALPGLEHASSAVALSAVGDLKIRLGSVTSNRANTPLVSIDSVGNPSDPNTFPIRGARGSGGLYWADMNLYVEGIHCTDTCEVTDRYSSRITVNPGATTTRFNGTNSYFPNSGHLQNKHYQMWSVCRGTVCGKGNTGNLPNASQDFLSGYGDRHSNVLTSAITLWVYFTPFANYIADGGKTHDADCEAANIGNACRYSD